MFGKQLDKTFNKPQFLGGIIGGIGGAVVSGLFGNKQQKEAQKHADSQPNEHELLDEISGGAYGNYMKNYAFQDPATQGQMARDMQSNMYPELNPWELAGSSSAGVAGAMGENASSNVQQAAAREHDTQMKQMQIEADLAKTQMASHSQQAVALINAGAQITNNQVSNETQREAIKTTEKTAHAQMDTNMQITEMQLAQAQKQLDLNTTKVEGELAHMASQMEVNEKNAHLLAEKAVTEYMTQSGIQLSNEAKDLANTITRESLQEQIQTKKTGTSSWGKFATDVAHAANGAIEEVLQMSTSAAQRVKNSTGGGIIDKLRQGVGSFFEQDSPEPKTHPSPQVH